VRIDYPGSISYGKLVRTLPSESYRIIAQPLSSLGIAADLKK
jgi:hypothetical protein